MHQRLDDFGGLLNWERLSVWIDANALPGSGPPTQVEKLKGGSQNNLFRIWRNSESFVLRRPPLHPRPNSNATIVREGRILKALAETAVPHPRLYAVCEDLSVIGVNFYAMTPLEGFSPMGELIGAYDTDGMWREKMGVELAHAAASLGAVDYMAVGLADLGNPKDWHSRQVSRWQSQLQGYSDLPNYGGHTLKHVEEIGRWLEDHVPKTGRIGIMHGDLQFPNVMFSLLSPRISGVIDWELATLGDPLLDLGIILSSWWEDGDPEGKQPMVRPWNNFISRSELVRLYGAASGRDMSEMPWYFCLACFRQACIIEGTYARAKAGQASLETGERLHAYAQRLLSLAKRIKESG